MIGDNPAGDIIGANEFGWKSILVRTGVYKSNSYLEPK
jgi:ribonucleotide monophosphatase NagD (HAD superfamily)